MAPAAIVGEGGVGMKGEHTLEHGVGRSDAMYKGNEGRGRLHGCKWGITGIVASHTEATTGHQR